MSLSTAQQVRLEIQDKPRLGRSQGLGDGSATTFSLPHENLQSGTAYISTTLGWSATAATFDPSGTVTFGGRISANSAFQTTYIYSVFSDDEIDYFLTAGGGNVNGASLKAIRVLMFDGLKRARWSAPDGSSFDDTASMKLLTDLYDRLRLEGEEDSALSGASASWSLDQELY